jgi:hypothetical protein
MNTRQKLDFPTRLEKLRQRFEHWRQTHPPRSRIAGSLWAAAVKMAGNYGIYRTAQALRVNYYALKKQVERASADLSVPRTENAAATFIELPPLVSAGSGKSSSTPYECTLEWEDAGGVKLRLHLPGIAASDLAALCRSLRP